MHNFKVCHLKWDVGSNVIAFHFQVKNMIFFFLNPERTLNILE